jgi:hypothetical protein
MVPWRPAFQIWCDLLWLVLTLLIVMFLNYQHSLIPISTSAEYLLCFITCFLAVNKVFYTACIFSIVYDKDNIPKHTMELYLWRLCYDCLLIVVAAYLMCMNKINRNLNFMLFMPLVVMEIFIYVVGVRISKEK